MMIRPLSFVHLILATIVFVTFGADTSVRFARAEINERSVGRAKYRSSMALRSISSRFLKSKLQRTTNLLLSRIARSNKKCAVSICFAVEASSSIPFRTFIAQKQLQTLVAAIVSADESSNFASVQYSRTTRPVAPATPRFYEFLNKVGRSKRSFGNSVNMAAGLGYCGFQVRKSSGNKEVVVVIGSGKSGVGFSPDFIAKVIERRSAIMYISTSTNTRLFTRSVGTKPRDVLVVRSEYDFDKAIRSIIPNVCQ